MSKKYKGHNSHPSFLRLSPTINIWFERESSEYLPSSHGSDGIWISNLSLKTQHLLGVDPLSRQNAEKGNDSSPSLNCVFDSQHKASIFHLSSLLTIHVLPKVTHLVK